MADPDDVARALGAIPSGLFVVSAGVGASATGFLASFVQQIGFEPPAVTVGVRPDRPVVELILRSKAFCVAILGEGSKALLRHFARGFPPGEDAFAGVETKLTAAGVPFPASAIAHLECELIGDASFADHVLVCGRVVGGARRDGQPAVHVRRNGLSY